MSSLGLETVAPNVSDIFFKYTWVLRKYSSSFAKNPLFDSPYFECNVNGIFTKWMLSIRFWRGSDGKRIPNPVLLCLNLVSCSKEEPEQIWLRLQFSIFDAKIGHWENSSTERIAIHMQTTDQLMSIGKKDLHIESRHYNSDGDISIAIKLQLIQSEVERHTLSQDIGRILSHNDLADTIVKSTDKILKAHACIISARSTVLALMLQSPEMNYEDEVSIVYELDLSNLRYEIVEILIIYMYTDKVDHIEGHAQELLTLAYQFEMPGLLELTERTLMDSLTPDNISEIMILADQCRCESLKRATLAYCEDYLTPNEGGTFKKICKTLAWRVMSLVNPDLQMETAALPSTV